MRQLKVRALRIALACCGLALASCACGPRGEAPKKPGYTAVNEAYTLLDHGEKSRAIQLLEQILEKQPENSEARLMLASAYMGRAGIDVFSLHDSFHDVLFSHSLSDVFLSKDSNTHAPDPLTGIDLPGTQQRADDTPAEKLFQNIDEFLNNVRRVLVIFDRFPHIGEAKWPLLEQALWNLDQIPLEREVRVYRMFIRMVYFKEVLVTRVIRDSSFGTRVWGCQVELQVLDESLFWLTDTLAKVSDDFIQIYPKESSPFVRMQSFMKFFTDEMAKLRTGAPIGGETSMDVAQRKIKEELRCGQKTP